MGLLCAVLTGCVSAPSRLQAVIETPTATSNQITAQVVPIDTSFPWSLDRKPWGFNLSAYFTAFELLIQNQTSETLSFDPSQTTLTDRRGRIYAPLNEKEGVQYYMNNVHPPLLPWWPQSDARISEETQKIVTRRVVAQTLSAGQSMRGVLYFKRVHPSYCDKMVLALPVDIRNTERALTFSFSCRP